MIREKLKYIGNIIFLTIIVNLYGIILIIISSNNIRRSGDEPYFYRSAVLLKEGLIDIFTNHDIPNFWNKLIEKGFFIPSTSFIVSPFLLISESIETARIILLITNVILTVWILYLIIKHFSIYLGYIYAFTLLLLPVSSLHSLGLWGGAIAGKIVVIICLYLYSLFNQRDKITSKESIIIGSLIGISCFFRPSLVILPLIVPIYFAEYIFNKKTFNFGQFINVTNKGFIIAFFCSVFILPWSILISSTFNRFTPSVTSTFIGYQTKYSKYFPELGIPVNKFSSTYKYYSNYANGDRKLIYNLAKIDFDYMQEKRLLKQKSSNSTFEAFIHRMNAVKYSCSRLFSETFSYRYINFTNRDRLKISENNFEKFKKFISQIDSFGLETVTLLFIISAIISFFIFSFKIQIPFIVFFLAMYPQIFGGGHPRHNIIVLPIMVFGICIVLYHSFEYLKTKTSKDKKQITLVNIFYTIFMLIFYANFLYHYYNQLIS